MQEQEANNFTQLYAICPLDGRYYKLVEELKRYFSEAAYIQYRYFIEMMWFKFIVRSIHKEDINVNISLSDDEIMQIKNNEEKTNHDVAGLIEFIRNNLTPEQQKYKNMIHFGITSNDINNPANTFMLYDFIHEQYLPLIDKLFGVLDNKMNTFKGTKVLSHTHGQPAVTTTFNEIFHEYAYRIKEQVKTLNGINHTTKFGGAVGNLSALKIAYPSIDWETRASAFIHTLKPEVTRQTHTTQVENYDGMSSIFDNVARINTILMSLCLNMWLYISKKYFKLENKKNEVGSSTMPHKINPIDFENARGNLQFANCIFEGISRELPIRLMQRDLSDSTILRNVGMPFGYTIIAIKKIIAGLNKLSLDMTTINQDLANNYPVVSEAIQTILRKYPHIENPYDIIKEMTRGVEVSRPEMLDKIKALGISDEDYNTIENLTPFNLI